MNQEVGGCRKHVGAEISASMYECKQMRHKGVEKRYIRISACTRNVSTVLE